jgi:hypothetical protein
MWHVEAQDTAAAMWRGGRMTRRIRMTFMVNVSLTFSIGGTEHALHCSIYSMCDLIIQ